MHVISDPKVNCPHFDVFPLLGIPIVMRGDDMAQLIQEAVKLNRLSLREGDVLVVAHTAVSKAEGCVRPIGSITITERAKQIGLKNAVDPAKVQLALDESIEVLRESPVLITKTHHGIITDYSAVDRSNAPDGCLITLPRNPDKSAEAIRQSLLKSSHYDITVIISDTHGRPWRRGAVNVAVGIAGMSPYTTNRGKEDLYGRPLRSSQVCLADELAAAAELVMGQADEGVPVVLIRGVELEEGPGTAKSIMRPEEENLFR